VFAEFVRPVGWIVSRKVLTETPYFPVQITLALLLGWTAGGWRPHKSMISVWVPPFVALFVAFVLYPARQPFVIEQFKYLSTAPALAHFFGSGCSVRAYCFDQLFLTMPFYAASSYSLAAWFRGRLAAGGIFDKPVPNISPKRTFLVSCLVWLCLGLDVYRNLFAENRLSLLSGIPIVVGTTLVFATATTLLIMIGSGFVRRKNLSGFSKSNNGEID